MCGRPRCTDRRPGVRLEERLGPTFGRAGLPAAPDSSPPCVAAGRPPFVGRHALDDVLEVTEQHVPAALHRPRGVYSGR